MRQKKRETEGEIVWNRKNQEDKKEISIHRYEKQREQLSNMDKSCRIIIKNGLKMT